jgi:hypothetical protein
MFRSRIAIILLLRKRFNIMQDEMIMMIWFEFMPLWHALDQLGSYPLDNNVYTCVCDHDKGRKLLLILIHIFLRK